MFMDIMLLLTRLLLAVIFVISGLAKLVDRPGSRQAMLDFGVPAGLASPSALLLPLAELVVAGVLIPNMSAWWGALGALMLLLLFTAAVGYHLARGHTPSCHCFGQISSDPIGWSTLVRNLILSALVGIVVGFGRTSTGASVTDWLATTTVVQRVEVSIGGLVIALVALECVALHRLLRQQGHLLHRFEVLEAKLTTDSVVGKAELLSPIANGTPAPAFRLPDLLGNLVTLDVLLSNARPVLLIFSDPGCGPCNALLPEIGRWQRDHATKLVVALISRGTVEANRPKVTEYGLTHVLLQKDREVAQDYQASGTPSAVLIRRDGTIGSPLAQGADAIRALIEKALSPAGLGTFPMVAANGNGNGAAAAPRPPTGPKMG